MAATTVISVRGRDRAALLADPDFVYVGRRCDGWPGSIWGNPFRAGMDPFEARLVFHRIAESDLRRSPWPVAGESITARDAVRLYEIYVESRHSLWDRLHELRGKTLGCWCGDWNPGEPDIGCHAVILAELADGREGGVR